MLDTTSTEVKAATAAVANLPNELLLHIWSFLDCWHSVPPSIRKFNNEPSLNLTVADDAGIKALSLVCKRWRVLTLPYLFKYAQLKLDGESRWLQLSMSLIPVLDNAMQTLSAHEQSVYNRLRRYAERASCQSPFKSSSSVFDLEYINDDDLFFRFLRDPFRCWIPSSSSATAFLQFVERNQLERKIHSLVVCSDMVFPEKPSEPLANRMNEEHEVFWKTILYSMNPTRIVVAMPPSTMAALTDGKMHTDDAWAFAQDVHLLELKQDQSESKDTAVFKDDTGTTFKYHRCLHNMRRWTHLAYNEGSFLPAYSTYEYFLKRPPMILFYLLFWLQKEAKYTPPRLRSVAYTGIFPFGTHITDIMEALHKVDEAYSLTDLELSFAPDPHSSILEDPRRLGQADLKDCWVEFESAYHEVIKTVARQRQAPGLRITSRDYRNEAIQETLDRKFQILTQFGWIKEGNAWVRPDRLAFELENLPTGY